MVARITASVGANGKNLNSDALTVQRLLNKVPASESGPVDPLAVDGLPWTRTIAAIKRFQSGNLKFKWPDGRVDPRGKTFARLLTYEEVVPPKPVPLLYVVPGTKYLIGQPTFMTCWATTYAMMRSWKEGKKFGIEEALAKPGQEFVTLFKQNVGLPPPRFREFWTKAGMQVKGFQCFPYETWDKYLRQYGMLAIGAINSLPPATGLHLRVLYGIHVPGVAAAAMFIMDPAFGGKSYQESGTAFNTKYELAMAFSNRVDFQIAHY